MLMINLQISQTSPTPGHKAKSHTCTMNSSHGRFLGHLVLLGTCKVVVKVKLISRLLDVWMCLESGQRSELHTVYYSNVWGSKAIMVLRHLPLDYEPENDEYAQQKMACWLFIGLVELWSALAYVAFIWKLASIICLLFIYSTITSLITNILVLAFTQNLSHLISYDSRSWIQNAFSQFRPIKRVYFLLYNCREG